MEKWDLGHWDWECRKNGNRKHFCSVINTVNVGHFLSSIAKTKGLEGV